MRQKQLSTLVTVDRFSLSIVKNGYAPSIKMTMRTGECLTSVFSLLKRKTINLETPLAPIHTFSRIIPKLVKSKQELTPEIRTKRCMNAEISALRHHGASAADKDDWHVLQKNKKKKERKKIKLSKCQVKPALRQIIEEKETKQILLISLMLTQHWLFVFYGMSINHFKTDLTRPDCRHVSKAWKVDKNHLKKLCASSFVSDWPHDCKLFHASMLLKKKKSILWYIATVQKTHLSLI